MYTYIYKFIKTYKYIHLYICLSIYTYVFTYIFIYINTCVCIGVFNRTTNLIGTTKLLNMIDVLLFIYFTY